MSQYIDVRKTERRSVRWVVVADKNSFSYTIYSVIIHPSLS